MLDHSLPSPSPVDAPPVTALVYTPETLASALAISVKTVRRMDATRSIPGRFTVGRQIRYRRAEVERWIAAGCPVVVATPRRKGGRPCRK